MLSSEQNITVNPKSLFWTYSILVLGSTISSILIESYLPLIIPILPLGLGLIFDDYRRLFYLLFMTIPFSVEYYSDSARLGTDLPSEPIMIFLTGITILAWIKLKFGINRNYIMHSITLFLFMHIFWIFVTSLNSENLLISLKVFTAKIWYVLPFFLFPLITFKETSEFEKTYKIVYKFLFVAICIVLVRHAFEGFSFAASHGVVRPFFRNHVNYAAISVVSLPFVWAFLRIQKLEGKSVKWLTAILIIFVVGIYFSFTRAAILSMIIALGAWFIIHHRWVKQALAISSFVAFIGVLWLSWNNKYMEFTPDFEKTITHREFDNLLEATYKLEDISSMERVYRWMAGIEMIKDRFWMGFGPGSFYSNYKSYSISRFQTYVSDNPEQSGIHNYYLMTWVEQGLIGFLIFIGLCFVILIESENLYHKCTNPKDKYLVMACALAFIIIFAMNLINDLIETDKVGPFFFLNMAFLLFISSKYKKSKHS